MTQFNTNNINNTNNIIDNDIIYNMLCNMSHGKLPIFENILIIKNVITKDNIEYNIRDNVRLTTLAWCIYNDANGNLDEAIKIYKENKIEYINKYINKFKK